MISQTEKKKCKWKPIGSRTVSRTRMRWEDDVINYLKKNKVTNLKGAEEHGGGL